MCRRQFHPVWAIVVTTHSHVHSFNEASKINVQLEITHIRLAVPHDNPMTGITAFVAVKMPITSWWASWCKHSGKV